jgi:hypothetical protein
MSSVEADLLSSVHRGSTTTDDREKGSARDERTPARPPTWKWVLHIFAVFRCWWRASGRRGMARLSDPHHSRGRGDSAPRATRRVRSRLSVRARLGFVARVLDRDEKAHPSRRWRTPILRREAGCVVPRSTLW